MDVSTISSLTRSELLGWHAVVTHQTEPWGRAPLDGEIAALTRRAQVLGMTLSASASRAALCAGQIETGPQRRNTRKGTLR